MKQTSRNPLWTVLALSLGPALALGLARFAYALLLPAMRDDLGLSFAAAGSLNTSNAAGYLAGALASVAWARRFGARRVLLGGCVLTLISLAACAMTRSYTALMLLRFAAGLSGAMVFSIGGVLAAQLASAHPQRAGLLLGIYYSGIGVGVVLSALLVPVLLANGSHGWQSAWWGLTALGGLATCLIWQPSAWIEAAHLQASAAARTPMRTLASPLLAALLGYFCFGVGYIGYMTFNVALLKGQGATQIQLTLFFSLLGLAICFSSRLWARLLDRHHDGKPMAILNLLAGIAALLPLISSSILMALCSGILFGACFVSAVASTTALVRHNLPAPQWPAGIALFTSIFAFGQIIGPVVTGWLSDGAGLEKGLLFSGLTLILGAIVATRQQALSCGK
ncbi:YbfB/YjiJ family MFS transporter [Uliginosibacterium sp. H3]|uniref:YbfB/YjiJ family MFS transporter n=1 Tax=Uliginosibacterium silvisoli TaxID=3114758 RepID=A0ABU6K9J8_9RHOO|nr:YbfB/YjiJ family MFS transporter [Uliginosibacterium sp. H3]